MTTQGLPVLRDIGDQVGDEGHEPPADLGLGLRDLEQRQVHHLAPGGGGHHVRGRGSGPRTQVHRGLDLEAVVVGVPAKAHWGCVIPPPIAHPGPGVIAE